MTRSILALVALLMIAISCASAPAGEVLSAVVTPVPPLPTEVPTPVIAATPQPSTEKTVSPNTPTQMSMPTATVVPSATATNTPISTPTATPTPTVAPTNTKAPTATATTEPSSTPTPAVAPTKTPGVERTPATNTTSLFRTSFDNGLKGFVWDGNSIAKPGAAGQSPTAKYSVVDVEARGKIFRAVQTGLSAIEDGKTRASPQLAIMDIIGRNTIEGNYGTHFIVSVSNLEPGLSLGKESNWTRFLSLWSAFDSGNPNYHKAVGVQLTGSDGHFKLITTVTDKLGKNTVLDRTADAPEFGLGEWIDIRVEVDVTDNTVYTYQDGKLISQGSYTAGTKSLSETHWGLYDNIDQAILMEDDIEIYTWK